MGTKVRTSETVYEEKKSVRRRLLDYMTITLAALIQGAAISLFLDPNQLAPGGVTGIAVILSRLTGLGTGTWILLLNIPILAIGLWKFGFRFLLSTLYCTTLVSATTTLLSPFGPVTCCACGQYFDGAWNRLGIQGRGNYRWNGYCY